VQRAAYAAGELRLHHVREGAVVGAGERRVPAVDDTQSARAAGGGLEGEGDDGVVRFAQIESEDDVAGVGRLLVLGTLVRPALPAT
jgi:hypothetical protein